MIVSLRRLATLEAVVEAETPFGGRARAYEPLAELWVDLTEAPADRRADGDAPPVPRRSARAVARTHPAALGGPRTLSLGPDRWRVTGVRADAPRPGFLTFDLESDRP